MFSNSGISKLTLVLVIISFILVSGCTSEGDACISVLSDINSLENTANGRLKVMDFEEPDELLRAQSEASLTQYSEALYLMTDSGASSCMPDINYKNRIRSIQLKTGLLELYMSLDDADKTIKTLSVLDYPEYRAALKDSITLLNSLRDESLYLLVMAGEIDPELLSPENAAMIPLVKSDIELLKKQIDAKISILQKYQ
ncbi:hypothetical protein F1737_01670 [Methanoplanus sp. FWC-SCC4]|uniref:Uncharacterized protein n=1 Tax=Methanochimaera problematica TaxID=2609417 RepID=A0AA97I3D2_9EURY|nr:hypothetical protein [Methanoplanus sp. FWC-SCC4]WOF15479.1 hypothetical protein F1737_01670 [Methanoplanus sp. FWC-SCC4]